MKTLAFFFGAMALAIVPASAQDKFSLPDLTVEPTRPKIAAPSNAVPLSPPKSQWSAEDGDKPAKSFGTISNGPCDGCKLSLRARQAPLYPNIGPSPVWDPGEPPPSDDGQ